MVEMTYSKQAGMEPLPGYRLIEPLGSGGYGEVWKCEVSGGIFKAIKFVRGNLNSLDPEPTAQQELAALERIKAIRHPFVVSLERVEIVDGELIIAMELADENLQDRLKHCQARGERGIDRRQLLSLLGDAAEALDLFNFEYDLQHLDVKPGNLFVVRNHVKVADFGLVQSLNEIDGASDKNATHGITPQYSSPEVFKGHMSRHSDQYSLAVVYQELLTGVPPFQGKNARQLVLQHMMQDPDLTPLPEQDRNRVAKALAKNPQERFSSCQEFIQSLQSSDSDVRRLPESSTVGVNRSPTSDSKKSSANSDTSVVSNADTKQEKLFNDELLRRRDETVLSEPNVEFIPGFRVLKTLGSSLPSKLWKLRAEDNQMFLGRYLGDASSADPNVEAFRQKIGKIQHPALPEQKFIQLQDRSLLLTEYRHPTLMEQSSAAGGNAGPALQVEELIDKIAHAASALDELYESYEVPHLGLHPNSFMSGDDRVWLVDFGFVPFFWLPARRSFNGLNFRYAAPEIAEDKLHRNSDQYSLALIYTELLTGIHPRPQSAKQLRRKADLDLTFLPSSHHKVLARALDPVPEKRFACCSAFVDALKDRHSKSTLMRTIAPMMTISNLHTGDVFSEVSVATAKKHWEEFIKEICGIRKFHSESSFQYVEKEDYSLFYNATVRLHKGIFEPKLQAFAEQWNGILAKTETHTTLVQWPQQASVWKRWRNGDTGVEIRIRLQASEKEMNVSTGVQIDVQNMGRPDAEAINMLQSFGPKALESLTAHLQLPTDQKTCVKAPADNSVLAYPILSDLTIGEPLRATAIDVSLDGIMLEFSEKPSFRKCYLQFDSDRIKGRYAFLARFVWREQTATGRFLLGGTLFTLSQPRG